jgi:GNAT superfamily N-acetyltransferase
MIGFDTDGMNPLSGMPAIVRNGLVESREIGTLRVAVGWDRNDESDARLLLKRFAYYTARSDTGALIGFLSVMSDGVSDALFLDLMVHPAHRRKCIGTRLVRRATTDVRDAGIQCVQLTCVEQLAPFYAHCGFHVCAGAIVDFNNMAWREGNEA